MSPINNLPSGAVMRRLSRNGNNSFQMLASLPLNAGNALGLGSYVSIVYNIHETTCSQVRQTLGMPRAPGQEGPKAIVLSNATAQVVLGKNGESCVWLLFNLDVKRNHTASDGFMPAMSINAGGSASAVSGHGWPQYDAADLLLPSTSSTGPLRQGQRRSRRQGRRRPRCMWIPLKSGAPFGELNQPTKRSRIAR